MRKLSDMTEEEKSAYRIWQSRLNNDLATPQEKQEARQQMDALEWGGVTGPVMEKIGALEERVAACEASKGGKGSAKLSKKAEADLVAHVIEEARTAIMAEAEAAAVAAVSKYMGERTEESDGGDF